MEGLVNRLLPSAHHACQYVSGCRFLVVSGPGHDHNRSKDRGWDGATNGDILSIVQLIRFPGEEGTGVRAVQLPNH